MKNKRINVGVRKVLQVGGSLGIVLPIGFCRNNGLRKGDEIVLIFDHELLVRPWLTEDTRSAMVQSEKKWR